MYVDAGLSSADVVGRLVRVDLRTGLITAAVSLDRETVPELQFDVVAVDSSPERPQSARTRVYVVVADLDDRLPVCTSPPADSEFRVVENEPARTLVGTVSARDDDLEPFNAFYFASVEYRHNSSSVVNGVFTGVPAPFTVDTRTGTVRTSEPLDRELRPLYQLDVVLVSSATTDDDRRAQSRCPITVRVLDVNDNPPHFRFPSAERGDRVLVTSSTGRGHVIARLEAEDPDEGRNGRIEYHLAPSTSGRTTTGNRWFSVDRITGEIRPQVDLAPTGSETSYHVTVMATDTGNPPLSARASIYVVVVASGIESAASKKSTWPRSADADVINMANQDGSHGGSAGASGGGRTESGLVLVLAVTLGLILVAVSSVVIVFCLIIARRRQLQSQIIAHTGKQQLQHGDRDDVIMVNPAQQLTAASVTDEMELRNMAASSSLSRGVTTSGMTSPQMTASRTGSKDEERNVSIS